jgi:hypothetical protein
MEYSNEISNYVIYMQTWPSDRFETGYGIVQKSKIGALDETQRRDRRLLGVEPNIEDFLGACPETDFFIDVFLTKTTDIYEYVDTQKDERIQPIERQEFNPFYINYSFFDTIERNHANDGNGLTLDMIDFIRSVRLDVQNFTNQQVRTWYTEIGRFEFPWNQGTANEVNIEDVDRSGVDVSNIVSKAQPFNIDINN